MNDERETAAYDSSLEKMEKKWMPGQDTFYIINHSFICRIIFTIHRLQKADYIIYDVRLY